MNAVCGYDFTISCEKCDDYLVVKKWLSKVAKKVEFPKGKRGKWLFTFSREVIFKSEKKNE